jgi:hypothetical protein
MSSRIEIREGFRRIAAHLNDLREQEEALADQVEARVESELGFCSAFVLTPGHQPEPCPTCREPIGVGETLLLHGEDQDIFCEACFSERMADYWLDRLQNAEPDGC